MSIENELADFLENNIKNGSNKLRDIEIIKFYYGLNESPWPTLEETASRFGVGTRERIRQLLNSKFRDHASKNTIPSLNEFIRILQSREHWSTSEFEDAVCASGLMRRGSHLRGIFNLVEDVNIDSGFEFYTPELKRATRNSLTTSRNVFLIKTSKIRDVEKLLSRARGLPGRCGIANLRYIREALGEHYKLISLLIKSSHTSWVKADDEDFWYIFENRDNTLINYMEKVFGVIDSCEPSRLAAAFRNALDSRTHQYAYPPTEIIEEYLQSSVYLANTDSGLKFIGETTKPNKIEEDLILFFTNNSIATYTELKRYLQQREYGEPHILKTTNHSPLIYVDKTQGRKHYTYSLIGRKAPAQHDISAYDVYEYYLRRLRLLLDVGTDETREQTARKEQHILQEWLFKDKAHENCAICGQEFSIKTLVTAHKKPRSECNDAERLDPYIVMPICLMGCDYLYENMYIYIDEAEIKHGIDLPNARTEASYIEKLVGRKIDSKWLLGGSSYFRSPFRTAR